MIRRHRPRSDVFGNANREEQHYASRTHECDRRSECDDMFSMARRITRNREDAEDVVYLRAAKLLQLGLPFDANQAQELGFVTRVVPDQKIVRDRHRYCSETSRKTGDSARGLQAVHEKALARTTLGSREGGEQRILIRVRSEDGKEAITAFFEKRPPDFTRTAKVDARRT